jgi:hypothetical protein
LKEQIQILNEIQKEKDKYAEYPRIKYENPGRKLCDVCACGKLIRRDNKKRHLETKYHKKITNKTHSN